MVILTKGETFREEIKADPRATVVIEFAGPQRHSIPATNDAGTFTVKADTANWIPGYYVWEAWATAGDVKTILCRKNLTLEQSATDLIGEVDLRSDVRKAVKYIREMLSGGASMEARRYKINNRELERHSIPDLLQLLSHWERKLVYEERKEKGASVLGPRIEFYI
jgi:hypothetical protein